jgi:Tfp pilus assembly protein PilF
MIEKDTGHTPPTCASPSLTDPVPQATAADKALQLDDSLAEAHASLWEVKYQYDFDWAGGEREFRRAIALNPSYAYAHYEYGYLLV